MIQLNIKRLVSSSLLYEFLMTLMISETCVGSGSGGVSDMSDVHLLMIVSVPQLLHIPPVEMCDGLGPVASASVGSGVVSWAPVLRCDHCTLA